MDNLFPTSEIDIADIEAATESDTYTGYKQSILYDIDSGQVLRDGQNRVLTATGIEAWKQWCFNCLNTERYSCEAYPPYFGIEKEEIRKAETHEEAEAILTMQITEALMADPYKRTKYVSSFTFNWLTPDGLEADITIQGIDDATIDLTISI